MQNLWHNLNRTKSLRSFYEEENKLTKTLNVYDLIFLGVGSTLGVGVYVLSGQIAKDVTGPGIILSFIIAAIANGLVGLSYAELGSRAPSSGSIYSYCYAVIGEFVAFIMGWNLITGYVIGSASVVRVFSKYIDSYLNNTIEYYSRQVYEIDAVYFSEYFDFLAFVICILFSVALSFGLKESILLNNIATGTNIFLILFFIVTGLTKVNIHNWNWPSEAVPRFAGNGGFLPYGIQGVIEGAGLCFYGFIGFDAIATTGSEVKNVEKALPIALIVSLFIICFAYLGLSTVLTLMTPYYILDETAPLSFAFSNVGYSWAQYILNFGSLLGLFTSLFGAFFPISRIIYTMANDGLLFRSFAKVNNKYGTPVFGTVFSGIVTGLLAALTDVYDLIRLNALGTLFSYTVIAICIIILRFSIDENEDLSMIPILSEVHTIKNHLSRSTCMPKNVNKSVTINTILFCMSSVFLTLLINYDIGYKLYLIPFIILLMFAQINIIKKENTCRTEKIPFQVPCVPVLPALSIFINIFLMLQFDIYSWIRFIFLIFIGFIIYFGYGIFNSDERISKDCRISCS